MAFVLRVSRTARKSSYDAIIRRNFVTNNNTPNFAIPGCWLRVFPQAQAFVMSGDRVVIEDNIITGNNTGHHRLKW